MIKKFLQKIFKKVSYSFFLKIHGRIIKSIKSDSDQRIEVKVANIEKDLKYNIYKITNGRLYTDRIHDTAVILDNKIVEEPSFQLRYESDSKMYNSKIEDNVVFTKGTPRILRNLKGRVLSLLTGGGGNNNYWHWLFDVLPRLGLCNKYINLEEINYFLLPNLLRKFQNETLDCLNIPINKRLSSKKFRHIRANELIVTDHPVVVTGNATKDIENVPGWIMEWLKNSFVKNDKKKDKKNKIYIDRKDTTFANLAFCQPRTKVIEFRSSNAGPVIENLAKTNNLNYHSITREVTPIHQYGFPNQQGSVEIPINRLSEILKN